jgi:ribonuclease H / adenosylcobalamin/alpha-ribazole phosphatase
VSAVRSVIVEADGGSRGNPGPAAYGAVLRNAETGEVIAEDGETLGVASNNVAEYSGLLAGLRLAAEFAPEAAIEVRMDSKLVVEQMSGSWKIKHPDMRSLALEADRLAPPGTTYTWVPRDQNRHADRLANEALDGLRSGVTVTESGAAEALVEVSEAGAPEVEQEPARPRGWAAPGAEPTRLILIRHGETDHTTEKRFSGGLASTNPGLNDTGREQVRATAEWLAPVADEIDVLISSPVRRTRESAEIIAEVFGNRAVELEDGFAEMEFGAWDGLTFMEVAEKHKDDLEEWLGSLEVAPGGGESFKAVEERVLAALERVLTTHAGKTVAVVSHVTPIKTLVAHALEAPLLSVFRMELSPASVTVLSWFGGGPRGDIPMASMRLYNARPMETAFLGKTVP